MPCPYEDKISHILNMSQYFKSAPLYYWDTPSRDLHKWSAIITSDWFDEMVMFCQGVKVYKASDMALADFPDAKNPPGMTALATTNCWPNVE